MSEMTRFEEKVYATCQKIPFGRVSTYGEIAKAIGKPKSFRAVGNALNKNPFAPQVPCHRVVKNNGQLGGFVSGQQNKFNLLREEGITIKDNKIIGWEVFFYPIK